VCRGGDKPLPTGDHKGIPYSLDSKKGGLKTPPFFISFLTLIKCYSINTKDEGRNNWIK